MSANGKMELFFKVLFFLGNSNFLASGHHSAVFGNICTLLSLFPIAGRTAGARTATDLDVFKAKRHYSAVAFAKCSSDAL